MDLFLAVTEEVRRHEEQSFRSRRRCVAAQFDGTVECRMRDPHQYGNTAALYDQLHQAHAVLESEVQKLAGGSQQSDPVHSRGGEKVYEIECGAHVGLIGFLAMRRDGGYENTANRSIWIHYRPGYRVSGVSRILRNSTGP